MILHSAELNFEIQRKRIQQKVPFSAFFQAMKENLHGLYCCDHTFNCSLISNQIEKLANKGNESVTITV